MKSDALLGTMILRNSKLSASNLMTQLVQDSKLCKNRDAMGFVSDARCVTPPLDAMIRSETVQS